MGCWGLCSGGGAGACGRGRKRCAGGGEEAGDGWLGVEGAGGRRDEEEVTVILGGYKSREEEFVYLLP